MLLEWCNLHYYCWCPTPLIPWRYDPLSPHYLPNPSLLHSLHHVRHFHPHDSYYLPHDYLNALHYRLQDPHHLLHFPRYLRKDHYLLVPDRHSLLHPNDHPLVRCYDNDSIMTWFPFKVSAPCAHWVVVEPMMLHSPPFRLSLLVHSLPYYVAVIGAFVYLF